MKIQKSPRRRWGRLGCELITIGLWLWVIWGLLLGVTYVNSDALAPDVRSGDLVLYERLLAPNEEELVVWPDGRIGRWLGEGDIVGRVILLWRGREI